MLKFINIYYRLKEICEIPRIKEIGEILTLIQSMRNFRVSNCLILKFLNRFLFLERQLSGPAEFLTDDVVANEIIFA